MISTKNTDGINMQVLLDKIQAKRKIFYWVLPFVFVASLCLSFFGTKQYTSKIMIVSEDQLAFEENRVYTYNRPENYDLGVLKTDCALNSPTYKNIISGQSFLIGLLNDSVETIDGNFKGTLQAYLQSIQTKYFWQKEVSDPQREQVALAEQLGKQIDVTYDDMTFITTLKVTTPDSRVSQMVAESIYKHLSDHIRDYQDQKMQLALQELEEIRDKAQKDYEESKAANSPDMERLETIYRSFQRQVVVYQAQMLYHPAIAKVQDANLSFKPDGSGTATKTVGITLLVALLMAAWICRKELIAWF